MFTKQKPLSGEWLKAIKLNPDEFTEYATQHPLKLKNVIIKKESISKSTINGAEFINTSWEDSFAKAATISNTIFKGGDIYHTSFARSTLTNVTFEDMTLEKTEFVNATLINVTFKNCKINGSNFTLLHTSKILIENSELNDVSFYRSELDITIKNSAIEAGGFNSLKPGSKLYIEETTIGPYSEFNNSKLASFTLKKSNVLDAKMNYADIDKLVIEDTEMDFAITGGTYSSVKLSNIDFRIVLARSTFNSLLIEDCKKNIDIHLFRNTFKSISIRNCPSNKIDIRKSVGEKFLLSDILVKQADLSALVVKELTLNKVIITEDANFENTMANESLITNFSIKKGSKVNMAGTNIKFK